MRCTACKVVTMVATNLCPTASTFPSFFNYSRLPEYILQPRMKGKKEIKAPCIAPSTAPAEIIAPKRNGYTIQSIAFYQQRRASAQSYDPSAGVSSVYYKPRCTYFRLSVTMNMVQLHYPLRILLSGPFNFS